MSNRFEKPWGGFLDLAVAKAKKAETFLNHVDQIIDWGPIERFFKANHNRHKDAVGNQAYQPMAMFKVLLLQRWYNLNYQGTDDALADRISFRRFAGMSFDYAPRLIATEDQR